VDASADVDAVAVADIADADDADGVQAVEAEASVRATNDSSPSVAPLSSSRFAPLSSKRIEAIRNAVRRSLGFRPLFG